MPQTLVGLFLDAAQARKVTAELDALGVPPKQIEVLDAYVSSFEQRIDGVCIPADDAAIYKEGVRRGGALVLAGVESELADRAGVLMDDHGAADIDDLAHTWALKDTRDAQEQVPTREEPTGNEESSPPELESVEADPEESTAPVGEVTIALGDEAYSGQHPVSEPETQEGLTASSSGDKEIELPGGLRLRSVVIERPVEENVPVLAEHVTVERRPASREATEADFQAFEQGVMDLVELAEELVISKKARVVEEIVITKKVRQTTETVRDNLKHTQLTTAFLSDRSSSPE